MAKSIPNDIFQYSLHSAYEAGLKDGGPPVAFLTNHGNHGLGVFEDEESDLIQVDSVAYSIDKDGDVEPAEKDDQLKAISADLEAKDAAKAAADAELATIREALDQAKASHTEAQSKVRFVPPQKV